MLDKNPDGSPDARRESTWLGTAARLSLAGLAFAPFVGPAARGIAGAGKAIAGAAKPFGKMYQAAGLKGLGVAAQETAKSGGKAISGAARQAYADPSAAIGAATTGLSRGVGYAGRRYKDFYGPGGEASGMFGQARGAVDPYLQRARSYFGL